jgi:choline dehydrogenase-like flavoprotein
VADTVVQAPDIEPGRARGFPWRRRGAEGGTLANHLVLAANAIFNANLLQRSGDKHPMTGRRLNEQVGLMGRVYLDGIDSFQGSTFGSGYGTMLYHGDLRCRTRGAAMLETNSVGPMRTEPGRWRQVLPIRLVIEDLPDERTLVRLDPADPDSPVAVFNGISTCAERSVENAEADLENVFRELPVDRIEPIRAPTETRIQGTTVTGSDPASSVVDQDGLLHVWRDVRGLGSSVFPTGAPANPTLTLSAHALRAAVRMEAS